MGNAAGMQRAIERIDEVCRRGNDVVTLWSEVSEIIGALVPNLNGPCCYTLDPATLLITSHFNPSLRYEVPEAMLRGEYLGEDVHDVASVARSPAGISTIHAAAGGDPRESPRWQANMALGGDQELLVSLRTRDSSAWGTLGLYREPGRAEFSAEEIEFLGAVSASLADGLRRALLIGEARDPDRPDAPGLLVLSASLEVESMTPGTERWVGELPGAGPAGALPPAVTSVATAALRGPRDDGGREAPLARVLSTSGTWVVLHAATLVGAAAPRVAVIVEPAHPARIIPLLMAAYGLTAREQEITQLVLHAASTNEIASRLVVSPHTVQEHLKNVFEKTGVRSRRELVGKVFFSHYEPRLRDNEQRVLDGRPLRGGPAPGSA